MQKINAYVGQVPEQFSQKRRIPRLPLVVIAVLAGAVGVYALISSFAATSSCTTVVSSTSAAQSSVNSATPGQTVCLSDGTYGGITLNTTKASPGVTLQAQNPGSANIGAVSINGSGLTLSNFNVNGEVTIQPGSSNITVLHNKITGGYFGVDACNSTTTTCNDVKIIGNKFQGPYGEDAIRANRYHDADGDGFGLIVSQNEFTKIIENGEHSDCLQTVWVGDGIEFDHNYEHDNHCQGFFIKDQNSLCGSGTSGVCGTVTNVKVYDNIFTRNSEPCASTAPNCGPDTTIQLFGPEDKVSIDRNTMWGGDLTLTLRDPGWSNVSVTNNVAVRKWSDTSAPFNSTYTASNNLFCNTTYSGSWPDTGFTSNCNPPFPAPTLAGGDDFRLGGSQGVDWAPSQYTYGPLIGAGGGTTTPPPPADTTAPTVSVTAPANGSTVSGSSVAVSANASDDTGVTGVQFKLDGNNLGSEDTSSPYNTTWDTTKASNGSHTLTAVARDAAGNTKTSSSVTVTVSNSTGGGGTGGGSTGATRSSNCFSQPSACGYPDPTNTGVPAGTSLTASGSITASTAGQVIDAKDVTGTITIAANNVTVQNSRVTLNSGSCGPTDACGNYEIKINSGVTGTVIKNSELRSTAGITCEHDVRNLSSGTLQLIGDYLHGCDSNLFNVGNATLTDTYGLSKIDISNDHVENIYFDDSTVNINHSTLFNPVDQTAVVFGNVNGGGGGTCSNHLTVNNSFIAGGGYTFYPCGNGSSAGSSATTVTNTHFARCLTAETVASGGHHVCQGGPDTHGYYPGSGSYGLTAYYFSNATNWSGNVWDDNLQPICVDGGNGCAGTGGGSGGGSTTDTTAPTVSFSSPTKNVSVSGIVTATAAASDNVGVSKVEFTLDNASSPAITDTTSPYNYSFDSKTLTNGTHTITAKAYDAAGNSSSSSVSITVNNADTTPPSTPSSVKATAANATTVNLSWGASTDASGIAKYNVLRNGVVIAQPTTTSYTDTTAVANNSYSYVVQAMDAAGNVSASSAAATVTTPAAADTTPPTTPTNPQASAVSVTQVNLTWGASTDTGSGVAGYNVYRNGSKLNSSLITTTSYGDSTASASNTYSYKIEAVDGAGNKSAQTNAVSVTTGSSDTTAPSVSVTAPANNASVSGSNVTVSANASDNVGVVGVQFKLDGNNLGNEDLASPYNVSWDTTAATNGTHTLTAIARDAAGNTKTSSNVTVTVNNASTGGGGGAANCTTIVSSTSAAQSAVSAASPGQTVCLTNGTYGKLSLNASKTAPGVTVQAQNPGQASIAGANMDGKYLTIAQFRVLGEVDVATGSTGMTITHNFFDLNNYKGFGIIACPSDTTTCNDISITNNRFIGQPEEDVIRANRYHDANGDGIGLLIQDNEFSGNQEIGDHNDNFQSVWAGDHLVFRRNYLHDFGGQGFFVKDQDYAIDGLVSSDNLIVNQDLPCNPTSLCPTWQLSPFQVFGPLTNSSMTHNTVGFSSSGAPDGGGAVLTGSYTNADFSNNVFSALSVTTSGGSGTNTTGSNNTYCTSSSWPVPAGTTVDCKPAFIDPAHGDFRQANGRGVDWKVGDIAYGPGASSTGTGGSGSGADTTAPTVSIAAPANGSTVSGIVTATASAGDDTAVTKVEFYLDNASSPAITDTSAPYNYSFDSKTLSNGSHTLAAKAYDAAGNVATKSVTFTINNADTTPPTAPGNVHATAASPTSVNLTWTASSDNGGPTGVGIAKYNVLRNGVVIAQATSPGYTDATAVADTSYSYVIQAMDAAGNVSSNSTAATVTTPSGSQPSSALIFSDNFESGNFNKWYVQALPGRITDLTGGAGQGSRYAHMQVNQGDVEPDTGSSRAELTGPTFNAGDDLYFRDRIRVPNGITASTPWELIHQLHETNWGGSPGIAIFLNPGPTFNLRNGKGSPNFWESAKLTPNQWYEVVYHVKLSQDPNVGEVQVWLDGKPQTLTNGQTTMHGTTIQTDQTYLKVGIYRSSTSTGTSLIDHDDIAVGTTYASVTGGSTTQPADTTPPSTPTGLKTVAASSTQVNLSWNASTDSGGSGLAGYNIYRNGSKINDQLITTTSYGDSAAKEGTSYTYMVEAVDGAGNKSDKTAGANVSTPQPQETTPPSTPSNVKATAVSTTQVSLTWDASTDNNGGSGLAGYNIYRNGSKLNTAPITTTTYSDTALLADTSYSYQVEAVDKAGNVSDMSGKASVTTPKPSTGTGGGNHTGTASVIIIVIGHHGKAVGGATVTINGQTATTNKYGVATFRGVPTGKQPVSIQYGGQTISKKVRVESNKNGKHSSTRTPQRIKLSLVNESLSPALLLIPVVILVAAALLIFRPLNGRFASIAANGDESKVVTSGQIHTPETTPGRKLDAPGTVYSPDDKNKPQ